MRSCDDVEKAAQILGDDRWNVWMKCGIHNWHLLPQTASGTLLPELLDNVDARRRYPEHSSEFTDAAVVETRPVTLLRVRFTAFCCVDHQGALFVREILSKALNLRFQSLAHIAVTLLVRGSDQRHRARLARDAWEESFRPRCGGAG
jgi:hypothetical protein